MTEEQITRYAKSLAESTTAPAIVEWMQGWVDMEEDHPQYNLRDDQIKIGEMALKETNQ
jgi:hypothetical protein